MQETVDTLGDEWRESFNYHGWARSTNKTALYSHHEGCSPPYTEHLCCHLYILLSNYTVFTEGASQSWTFFFCVCKILQLIRKQQDLSSCLVTACLPRLFLIAWLPLFCPSLSDLLALHSLLSVLLVELKQSINRRVDHNKINLQLFCLFIAV